MGNPLHPPEANEYWNHVTWRTRWGVPHFEDITLGEACLRAIEGERKRIGLNVFAYTLLPDHTHLIIGPTKQRTGYVVQALKLASVHRLMADGLATGGLWQRGYFDRALRDLSQLRTAIDYVHNNPVVAGLALEPDKYILSSYADWLELREGPILLARDELSLI